MPSAVPPQAADGEGAGWQRRLLRWRRHCHSNGASIALGSMAIVFANSRHHRRVRPLGEFVPFLLHQAVVLVLQFQNVEQGAARVAPSPFPAHAARFREMELAACHGKLPIPSPI